MHPTVQIILNKLGEFDYNYSENQAEEGILDGPYLFENEAIYYGECKNM